MVHINSLAMKGFKSFNVKTSVQFSKKLTSVVGPNGSGKSNILDAVCFVLGRLAFSSMRASKGTDLIYSPKGKKGAEYAEVRITLDNSQGLLGEKPQVVVSRRVHRDGMSTYRIDGKRTTRTKLLDLFAQALIFPDGHNIVQQGDIVSFIKRSAEDRRKEIDAIAGIEAYEDKKRKAAGELDSVLQKISQVSLLMSERKRRLERLEKERERARAYRTLIDRRSQIEGSILARRIAEREKFIEGFEQQLSSRKNELEKSRKIITESEVAIKKFTSLISELEEKLASEDLKEKMDAARELEKLRHEVESHRTESQKTAENVERMKARIEQLVNSRAELDSAIEKTKKKLDDLEAEREQIGSAISVLEKERKDVLGIVEKAKERRQAYEKTREKLSRKLDDEKDKLRELSRQRDMYKDIASQREKERERTKRRLEEMERSRKSSFEERRKNEKRLREVEAELEELSSTRSRVSSRLEEVEADLEVIVASLRKLEDRHLALKAKDGMTVAAEELLAKKDTFKIHGLVRDLFTADEKNMQLLRAAAGPNMDAFVVENERAALAAIAFLHKEHLGRARFIPLSDSDSPLLGLASFDSKYKGALANAFGDLQVGELKEGAIDSDGTVKCRGIIIGGHDQYDTRELESLRKQLSRRREEQTALKRELLSVSDSIRELEIETAGLKSTLENKPFDAELAGDLQSSLNKLENERDDALARVERIESKLPETEAQISKTKEEIDALKDPGSVDFVALAEIDEKTKKLRSKLNDINLEFNTLDGKLKNVLLPDSKNTETVLKDTRAELDAAEKSLPKMEKQLGELEKQLEKKRASMEKAASEVQSLREKHAESSSKLSENREAKARAEGSIGRLEVEVEDFNSQIEIQKKELSELQDDFKKYGEIEVLSGSLVKLQDGLAKVERRISTFGAVNMTAQSEFEEAEGKMAEVEERAMELEKEKVAIEDFISQVELRKREAFMSNFNKIAGYFGDIFKRLAGGPGELLLENEKNPFEGGLIVQASPRGKEIFRMESMSGGEKTLTALAFVFAIQRHKPAPFYIFDEVEAALDKKNSEKVGDLLREMSETAQIIMITHNDAVMRVSDQLIGVSMTKTGVSRIVSADPKKLLARKP